MWMLQNNTPFEAERTWVRDKNGLHHWIVVIKATYDIAENGTLTISEEPVEPLFAAEYNGEDGLSSVKYEADLTAMKPSTDIYMNGVAYAPDGRATNKVKVGLQVNNWKKELNVFGDRVWQQNMAGLMTTTASEKFTSMPIVYERAFGGTDVSNPSPRFQSMDMKNPTGTGVYSKHENIVGKPAPNIENIAKRIGKNWPAGYGAIASYWSPRIELMGTYDKKWAETRKPLLPNDYDPKSLMCSPLDQQPSGYMNGGAVIQLHNLTPNNFLSFTIPKINYSFDTYFGSAKKQHFSQLVSTIIDSEGPRLILVWQTSLPVGNDGDYLDKTVINYQGNLT